MEEIKNKQATMLFLYWVKQTDKVFYSVYTFMELY